MVAVIKPGQSMHRIFNYNENKVKEGVAECIGAENFPLNAEDMTLKIKLGYLLQRLALRRDVAYKTVHISLNFDPSEIRLGKEKLVEIANIYMQKLGFCEQPYLIYQHHDAGHPHIHIVSTNIQSNGDLINLHHLGIRKSEPARKEIEQMFGLVVADAHARREVFRLKPVDASKVQYGRTETKRAITNVLDTVLDKYKYTSLPELNAVLKQYNVMADRGSERSRIFQGGGLVYRILDEDGKPVGVPVKASDFYNKPTLKLLETKYAVNNTNRQPFKARVKNEIDRALLSKKISLDELVKQLERKGIHVAFRQNDAGLIYGVTYVDHQTKCIFNGSDLGKQYSAKAMQERCLQKGSTVQDQLSHPAPKQDIGLQPQAGAAAETKAYPDGFQPDDTSRDTGNIIDALMHPEQVFDYIPGQLKRKNKKKKKRKNISDNK
ncbi:relaxase/mobilization nuclease domain-containing protein [Parafilimonas terrae]|uniref:Relaxase/Mobilisation nuclease domain-containing protein n=1 Tax=Parafilimonas terrae TaxID=1465490 RepID=A0A1I5TA57_9BACT|nr:relaxase/mobilization nuclease domain-containing protein [Parafilimonas terrae]SFP79925.1 Relaxase/Mobilisation nuclease domain-containing protein [Parafilimonas terrae]